jgi:hypothetical protein
MELPHKTKQMLLKFIIDVDIPNKNLNSLLLIALKDITTFIIPQSLPYKADFPNTFNHFPRK